MHSFLVCVDLNFKESLKAAMRQLEALLFTFASDQSAPNIGSEENFASPKFLE
jgi:hypothetical protein